MVSALFYFPEPLFTNSLFLQQAFSFGLADMLAADGETAAAACLRLLRPNPPLDARVIFGAKRAVCAGSAAEETRVFEGLWGQGPHAAAFAAALKK